MSFLAQIRKAAQAWENTIWNAADVNHIEMPTQRFRLRVTDDWTLSVRSPEQYLGWTDMEIVVYVDDRIETVGEEENQILAGTGYYPTDADRPGTYMPIVLFGIAPFTAKKARNGTLDYGQFYRLAVHELGHALGISGITLERLNKVRKTATACSYVGTNGTLAFSIMKDRTYSSVPMEADCRHWDKFHTRWRGVWDVMFQGWAQWDIPNDKLISIASLGVLDDLGFAVDYGQADDTAIARRDDPRYGVAKPTATSPVRCVPPTVMPSTAIEWID